MSKKRVLTVQNINDKQNMNCYKDTSYEGVSGGIKGSCALFVDLILNSISTKLKKTS